MTKANDQGQRENDNYFVSLPVSYVFDNVCMNTVGMYVYITTAKHRQIPQRDVNNMKTQQRPDPSPSRRAPLDEV
jgi:hypothetical protein